MVALVSAVSGQLALYPSGEEVLDCFLPAFFVWVGLENMCLRWLKLHYEGENFFCELLASTTYQAGPDA